VRQLAGPLNGPRQRVGRVAFLSHLRETEN
jgi:hypothetical protein